jgi:hypothetical protein
MPANITSKAAKLQHTAIKVSLDSSTRGNTFAA